MAHINEKHDLCTDAYIVNGDAVLLRLHEKYDIWIGPGGHVDPGEDPNEAVLREVWEETGLKIQLVPPPGYEMISGDSEVNDKNSWSFCYSTAFIQRINTIFSMAQKKETVLYSLS